MLCKKTPNTTMLHFSLPDFSKHIVSMVKETMYHPTYEKLAVAPPETSLNFKPVHLLFEEQVALNKFSTCLIYGDTIVSFNEVNTRANQLARYLIAKGITPNKCVPLCIGRSIEFVIAMLAILKAGGVYVPLDTSVPRDRIQFILMDLAAGCIICSKESSSLVNDFNIDTIELDGKDQQNIASQALGNLQLTTHPTDLAYIIYTSGSTGKPKGVMIEHHAFSHYVTNSKTRYINNDDNTAGSYIYLSNAFDASITALFMPMLSGKMAVISSRNKSEVFEDPNFRKYAPYDFLKVTPAHLDFLIPTLEDTSNSWVTKRLVIGGEALYAGQLEAYVQKHLSLQIINEYGPTETAVGCTTFSLPVSDSKKYKKGVPIGTPINNICIYLFKEKDGKLQPCIEGEIYIGGHGLARGYLNRNDLTEEKFIINPIKNSPYTRLYKTGDVGKWLPDGNLVYVGRIDDQVKISGYRIELGEIENTVNALSFINSCCVLALQQGASKKLVCYYVHEISRVYPNSADEPGANDECLGNKNEDLVTGSNAIIASQIEKKLRSVLQSKLPDYMMPARFIMLTKIPLTSNGKIDRNFLSELSIKEVHKNIESRSITKTEQKILKIWKRVLDDKNIQIWDDFFSITGDSIQAAAIMNLVNRNFSTHLPLTTLIHAPTITQLAAVVDGAEKNKDNSCIYTFRSSGSKTPLILVHAGDGDILFYRQLSNALNDDQPVYGIMAKGLDGKQPPLTNVHDLASFYVAEILRLQPKGPYRLAGYCFGAVLCFEMAHILTKKMHDVDFLASFNGISPTYIAEENLPEKEADVIYGRNLREKLYYHYKSIKALPLQKILFYPFTRLHHKFKILNLSIRYRLRMKLYDFFISRNKALPAMLARKYYFYTNTQMVQQYKPAKLNVSMTTFRSPKLFTDPTLGWKNLVEGKIACVDIPGNHQNRKVILDKPNVTILAEKLSQCLAKLDESDHLNF